MSNVYDSEGRLINRPGIPTQNGQGVSRYKDANSTVLDWFDTHPRVKAVVAQVEEKAKEVVAEVKAEVVKVEAAVVAETEKIEAAVESAVTFPVALVEKAIVNEAAPSDSDVPQV